MQHLIELIFRISKLLDSTRLNLPQHTDTVDFSFNPLADNRFMFHDHALVEAVKLENPEVHAFFRLLALCHTVMAEEKKEGEAGGVTQLEVKESAAVGLIHHSVSCHLSPSFLSALQLSIKSGKRGEREAKNDEL